MSEAATLEPSVSSPFPSRIRVPPSPLPGFTSMLDLQCAHTCGWVAEATQKPAVAPHRCQDRAGLYNPHQRLSPAVPGCRDALGRELCSRAPGSIFLPAETFCLGCALVCGTRNPGLLPVTSAGPFIIGWEDLWPKKMERRRNIPGGRVAFRLDGEGLALNLLLKLETGSFHYE